MNRKFSSRVTLTLDELECVWLSLSECLDATDDDDRSAIFGDGDGRELRICPAGESLQNRLRPMLNRARRARGDAR